MNRLYSFAPRLLLALMIGAADGRLAAADPLGVPEAEDLLDGARLLDGTALHFDGVAASTEKYREALLARAADGRKDATHRESPSREGLNAKSDELEVQAAMALSEVAAARTRAREARADAKKLRDQAKARVASPRAPRGSVDVDGACEVRVDGIPRGRAPMNQLRLTVGAHRVECRDGEGKVLVRSAQVHEDASTRIEFPVRRVDSRNADR